MGNGFNYIDITPGVLIVFDGIDGTGKTTQVELLSKLLQDSGYDVVTSKEPTDGKYGAKVRESSFTGRYSFDEELDLFIKDREEHISTKILPALKNGYVVILDRYYYSTIAYQGIRCDDINLLIDKIKKNVLSPDMTLIFDIDPVKASSRIKKREDTSNEFEKLADQIQIREIYNDLCNTELNIVKIDADCSVQELHKNIIDVIRDW